MNFEVNGKVALVTGGASGIGLAIVKDLLTNGAKGVTVVDVNSDLGEKSVEALSEEFGKGRTIFVKADVTNREEFESKLDAFKKTVEVFRYIDILVNNAGVYNDASWENEVKINVIGVICGMILGIDNYLQKYRQGQEAVLVNISSIAGVRQYPAEPVYSSTKFAVTGATLSWGLPIIYERTKVRVLAICPYYTRTPMASQFKRNNLGAMYDEIYSELTLSDKLWLRAEDVSRETIRAIKKAESGTVWVVKDEGPAFRFILPDFNTMKNNTL